MPFSIRMLVFCVGMLLFPCLQSVTAARQIDCAKTVKRVVLPVQGLYAAIPAEMSQGNKPLSLTPDIKIIDSLRVEADEEGKTRWHKAEPYFTDPKTGVEVKGNFLRGKSLTPESPSKVINSEAFLDYLEKDPKTSAVISFPRWMNLDSVPPLVEGKGIPMGMFLSLRSWKILGLKYGEPFPLTISKLRDFKTIAEFEVAKREWLANHPQWEKDHRFKEDWQTKSVIPAEVKAELLRETHSIKTAEGLLAQLGLRIKSIRVSDRKKPPTSMYDVDSLIGLRLQKDWDVDWKVNPQLKIFTDAGLTLEDSVESDFNIYLETERIP